MSWLLLALLAASADRVRPDEVPLVSPVALSQSSGLRAMTASERALLRGVDSASDAQRSDAQAGAFTRLFFAGLHASGAVKSGVQRGGAAVGMSLGGRLPFAGARLGFMLSAEFGALLGSAADRAIETLHLQLPLALAYHERLGPLLLRLRAGPSFDWTSVVVRDTSGASARDAFWALGADAGVAALVPVTLGAFMLELGYHLFVAQLAQLPERSHGVTLKLGFSLFAVDP